MSAECSSCHESSELQTSENIFKRGRSFDVNRRTVYHSMESGAGYEGMASFCGIMNMPCMTKGAYYKQFDIILNAQEEESMQERKYAAERLKQKLSEEDENRIS